MSKDGRILFSNLWLEMKNFILKLPSFYNLVTALLLSKQMTEITLFNFLFCLIHLKKEVKESQLNVPF